MGIDRVKGLPCPALHMYDDQSYVVVESLESGIHT